MNFKSFALSAALSTSTLMYGVFESRLHAENLATTDKRATVDLSKSSVMWTGAKIVGGSHEGKVKISSGHVIFKDNKPVSGMIEVNMTSMTNTDVESPTWRKKLIDHLSGDDFFAVKRFPTARLNLATIKHVKDGVFFITGELTIKDITKPISFKATLTENKANNHHITTELSFDRTDFAIKYNSGKFFDNLGDKMIRDRVDLKVSLVLKDLGQAIIL